MCLFKVSRPGDEMRERTQDERQKDVWEVEMTGVGGKWEVKDREEAGRTNRKRVEEREGDGGKSKKRTWRRS